MSGSVVDTIMHPFGGGSTNNPTPDTTLKSDLGEPTTTSSKKSSGIKNLITAAIVIAVLYYAWPIIEAIILILPIPNPEAVTGTIKAVGNTSLDVVNSIMKSDT